MEACAIKMVIIIVITILIQLLAPDKPARTAESPQRQDKVLLSIIKIVSSSQGSPTPPNSPYLLVQSESHLSLRSETKRKHFV